MEGTSSVMNYKFALLGDSMVGKTSIFKKISCGDFYPQSIATIGTDKRTMDYNDIEIEIDGKIEKKNFSVSLFDTAGQERFRSITKNYIKGSDGIILIYDITNRESFEHVEMWLNSIKEVLSDWKASDYLILLLGNKLDLVEQEQIDRKVEINEAQNKCKNSGIQWGGECSAKTFTDSEFINLFQEFTVNIYKKLGDKNVNNNQHVRKIARYRKKKKFC